VGYFHYCESSIINKIIKIGYDKCNISFSIKIVQSIDGNKRIPNEDNFQNEKFDEPKHPIILDNGAIIIFIDEHKEEEFSSRKHDNHDMVLNPQAKVASDKGYFKVGVQFFVSSILH